MPNLEAADLCILGEFCLEFHGKLSEDSASSGVVKNTAMLSSLEANIGGCGLFGAATAMSMGVPTQLIAHVGAEFPFTSMRPSNGGLLDEILAFVPGRTLVVQGAAGTFFSFWDPRSRRRTLYGKPGRGLRAEDLENIRIGSNRIAILSQSDPGIYGKVRHVAEERESVVVCAPNRALEGDEQTLADYMAWGDLLVVNRSEAERYFGARPELTLARWNGQRKAFIVITEADRDISIVSPDNSCWSISVPWKADVTLLGAGDSFATALTCFWNRFSADEAIRLAAAEVLNVQPKIRPNING